MTKTQIEVIMTNLGLSVWTSGEKVRSPLPGVAYIILPKKELKTVDQKAIRFLFDTTNEVMELTYCRPYSIEGDTPSHGHYDIFDDKNGVETVYEYLTDLDGNLFVDYYGFDAIYMFGF